jgi:hypothetical protein
MMQFSLGFAKVFTQPRSGQLFRKFQRIKIASFIFSPSFKQYSGAILTPEYQLQENVVVDKNSSN